MRQDAISVSLRKGGNIITLFKCWINSTGGTVFIFVGHSRFRRRQYYTKWRVQHRFTSGTNWLRFTMT